MRWHFDDQARQQIAPFVAIHLHNAFSTQLEYLAALSSRRYSQMSFAFKRRNIDLPAKRGNRERDRQFAIKIIFVALEDFVFLDVDHDIKIALRPTANSNLSIS